MQGHVKYIIKRRKYSHFLCFNFIWSFFLKKKIFPSFHSTAYCIILSDEKDARENYLRFLMLYFPINFGKDLLSALCCHYNYKWKVLIIKVCLYIGYWGVMRWSDFYAWKNFVLHHILNDNFCYFMISYMELREENMKMTSVNDFPPQIKILCNR